MGRGAWLWVMIVVLATSIDDGINFRVKVLSEFTVRHTGHVYTTKCQSIVGAVSLHKYTIGGLYSCILEVVYL